MGDCINCKSLDNRVSVFILIEMFREMKKKPTYDVYGVFTVQEEIGIRELKRFRVGYKPRFWFWTGHNDKLLTLREALKKNRFLL